MSYLDKILGVLKPAVNRWETVWQAIGVDQDLKQERQTEIEASLKDFLASISSNEEQILDELQNILQQHYEVYAQLRLELKVTRSPLRVSKDEPLLNIEKIYRDEIARLESQKVDRIAAYATLESAQDHFCKLLRIEKQFEFNVNAAVPSKEELTRFQNAVKEMFAKAENHMFELDELRENLIQYMSDLGITKHELSKLEVELLKFKCEPENISTTTSPLFARAILDELQQSVYVWRDKLHENIDKGKELNDKIIFVCQQLDYDPDKYTLNSVSFSSLAQLERNLEELKAARHANMRSIIARLRERIRLLLHQLFLVSPLVHQNILQTSIDSDSELGEVVINTHEEEVLALESYKVAHAEVLEAIADFHAAFAKKLDLEAAANDPNRYKNRGAGLLSENKNRANTEKALQRLRTRLVNMSTETNFTVEGMKLDEYVEHKFSEYEQDKIDRRMARKQACTTPSKVSFATTCNGTAKTPKSQQKSGYMPKTPASLHKSKVLHGAKRRLDVCLEESPARQVQKRRVVPNRTAPTTKVLTRSAKRKASRALQRSKNHSGFDFKSPSDSGFQPGDMSLAASGGFGSKLSRLPDAPLKDFQPVLNSTMSRRPLAKGIGVRR